MKTTNYPRYSSILLNGHLSTTEKTLDPIRKYPLLLLVLFSLFTKAQSDEQKTKVKLRFSEWYALPGLSIDMNTIGSLQDFQKLAPKSELLKSNLSDYSVVQSSPQSYNFMAVILMGFKFTSKEKSEEKSTTIFRVGLGYYSNYGELSRYMVKDSPASPSFIGIAGMDTVFENSLYMNYSSDQLRIDGSLIFNKSYRKRWNLHYGIGLTYGISADPWTSISLFNKYVTKENVSGESNSQYLNYTYIQTTHHYTSNKPLSVYSGYIPLGIGFKLGENHEFWKHIQVYLEVRPTLTYTYIPELGNYSHAGIQQGLGIKYSL